MSAEYRVMGLFKDEGQAISAIRDIKDSPWPMHRVHSPIPSHKIADALELKKSKVGYFTLVGGITGFFAGFFLAMFTASQWHLIVSGKPVISLVPFFIVGFEFTILFAVFGNVVGLIHQMRLPEFKGLEQYDPRCSGDCFGVMASSKAEELEGLKHFFQNIGGEVKVISNGSV
jgi:molybdopterin-containing oxidoreductase family membrane subunit